MNKETFIWVGIIVVVLTLFGMGFAPEAKSEVVCAQKDMMKNSSVLKSRVKAITGGEVERSYVENRDKFLIGFEAWYKRISKYPTNISLINEDTSWMQFLKVKGMDVWLLFRVDKNGCVSKIVRVPNILMYKYFKSNKEV